MLEMIAQDLDTNMIVSLANEQKIEQFLNAQTQLSLLESDSSSFPLVRQALTKYENTK